MAWAPLAGVSPGLAAQRANLEIVGGIDIDEQKVAKTRARRSAWDSFCACWFHPTLVVAHALGWQLDDGTIEPVTVEKPFKSQFVEVR